MYIPRARKEWGKQQAALYWIVNACGCTCKFSEKFCENERTHLSSTCKSLSPAVVCLFGCLGRLASCSAYAAQFLDGGRQLLLLDGGRMYSELTLFS